MIQLEENAWIDGWKEGRAEGRKDGHNLLHRNLPDTTGGLINEVRKTCCLKYTM